MAVAAACLSKKMRRRFVLASVGARPWDRRSLWASKTAIGKTGQRKCPPKPEDRDDKIAVTKPRPGHADLNGVLKYDRADIRDILERASARETVARTAVGSFAKQLLAPFGIRIMGYIRSLGGDYRQSRWADLR